MLHTFCDISAHFSSAAYRFDTLCSKTPTRILTIRGDNLTQATTTPLLIISSSQFISTAESLRQRRGSAAARLLGLQVRIPPGAWM